MIILAVSALRANREMLDLLGANLYKRLEAKTPSKLVSGCRRFKLRFDYEISPFRKFYHLPDDQTEVECFKPCSLVANPPVIFDDLAYNHPIAIMIPNIMIHSL